MCVVVFSPQGTALPGDKTLATCFKNNPDGAGLMWADEAAGVVHVRKGLMSISAVRKALRKAGVDWTEAAVVLHFRIGTQGANSAAMTHPFPLSRRDDILQAPASRCSVALAHNGIISLTADWRGGKAKHSDTYLFVRDYAALIVNRVAWHRNPDSVELLGRLAGSKLAVLGADGHCELIGDFQQGPDGNWYSNDSYRRRAMPTYAASLFEPPTYGRGKAVPDAKRTIVPRLDAAAKQCIAHSIDVCFDLPGDLVVYDAIADTLASADSACYTADRLGRVWRYDSDGLGGGSARLLPDAELWTEECLHWSPPKDATFVRVPCK